MIISTRDYSTLSMEDFDTLLAANGVLIIAHNHCAYESGYVVGGTHVFSKITLPDTLEGRSTASAEIAVKLNRGHDVSIWLGDGKLVIDSVDVHTAQGAAMLCACSRGEREYYHIDTNEVIATYIN